MTGEAEDTYTFVFILFGATIHMQVGTTVMSKKLKKRDIGLGLEMLSQLFGFVTLLKYT